MPPTSIIIATDTPENVRKRAEDASRYRILKLELGGTLAAREAITFARSHGLRVMLGCTVESSLGIAAAAHLAPSSTTWTSTVTC